MKGFSFSNNVRLQVFDSFLISQKYGLISLYNTMKGKSDWGKAKDTIFCEDNDSQPILFKVKYRNEDLSINYSSEFSIIPSSVKGVLLIGLCCNGNIVLWDYADSKSIIYKNFSMWGKSRIEDNLMKQFSYRYNIIYENSKKYTNDKDEILPKLEYMEEVLFDGTHDKLNDGGLLKYHQAGKPKKLAIKWHIGKSEYSAYFWFEEEPIREVFDKFYGAHPDTKTDFIIRIDAENRKYELALYRYGLKEPQIIPKNVYKLLVFKNKFEDYRSDNYNQERGAWIW